MATIPPRRLRKSLQERVLFGVCGGLADYLDVDVALVRVTFVLLAIVGGLGIIAYTALALFMGEPVTTAGNGFYQSPEYDNAPYKLELDIEGGAQL